MPGLAGCTGKCAENHDVPAVWPGAGRNCAEPGRMEARACLKIHSRHLHAPLRGILGPNSVSAAHCASFIRPQTPKGRLRCPTKWNAHLAESNFQTRSSMRWHGQSVYLLKSITLKSAECNPGIMKQIIFQIISLPCPQTVFVVSYI